MVSEIIAIWFSSVHQLAMTTIYCLEDLCLHLEYVESLRHEIAVYAYGDQATDDTKLLDISKLELLESFISESSRLSPLDAVSSRRKALKDFNFSGGTFVATGD